MKTWRLTPLIAASTIASAAISPTQVQDDASNAYMILRGSSSGTAQLKTEPNQASATSTQIPLGHVVTEAAAMRVGPSGKIWVKVSYGAEAGWLPTADLYQVAGQKAKKQKLQEKQRTNIAETPELDKPEDKVAPTQVSSTAENANEPLSQSAIAKPQEPVESAGDQQVTQQVSQNLAAVEPKLEPVPKKPIVLIPGTATDDVGLGIPTPNLDHMDLTLNIPTYEESAPKVTQAEPASSQRAETSELAQELGSDQITSSELVPLGLATLDVGSTDKKAVFSASREAEIRRKLAERKAKAQEREEKEKKKREETLTGNVNQTPVRRTSGGQLQVASSLVYVRAEPNSSYTPIMALNQGQFVEKTGLESRAVDGIRWLQVRSGGTTGWVPQSSLSSGGTVAAVRTLPSQEQPTSQPLYIDQSNGFDPYGIRGSTYVSDSFGTTAGGGQTWSVVGASGGLRMRSGPGTSFHPVASIPASFHRLISLGETQGSWMRVSYNGQAGWVNLDYLRKN